MSTPAASIGQEELVALERDVTRALHRGDDADLGVLGYGEISMVLGWPATAPRWACKRLPPFPSVGVADDYAATVDEYVALLGAGGVAVVDTEVRQVALADGAVAVYCVQPVLPADQLAVNRVRRGGADAEAVLAAVVDAVMGVVDDRVGLDAQLSNWAWSDGQLTYFDITTPLHRRADGRDALDTGLFLAALPWALRAPVRRFVVPDIIERYHRRRSVVLDLAANLIKERLDGHIPTVLARANEHLDEPLTEEEVRADYRSDARTWAMLLAVRRADRWWQRRIRRRTYPFLLPGPIER